MKRAICSLAHAVLAIVVFSQSPHAAVPSVLHYQGVLTDGGGAPITILTSVTFSLYNAPTSGNVKWTENRNVTPDSEGRFSILLGQATPLHDTVFKTQSLWLAVQIGVQELSPRSLVSSAAYAFRISTVDGAKGGNIIGDVEVLTGGSGGGLGVRDPGGNIGSMSSTSSFFENTSGDRIVEIGTVGLYFVDQTTGDTIFLYDPILNILDIGEGNLVSGSNSMAVGFNNSVSGANSSAFGSGNILSGQSSTAVGTDNLVSANTSGAFGVGNDVDSGSNVFAVGTDNVARGINSLVSGLRNRTVGFASATLGGADNVA